MEVLLFSLASCGLQVDRVRTQMRCSGKHKVTPTPTLVEGLTSAQKLSLRSAPFRELEGYSSC